MKKVLDEPEYHEEYAALIGERSKAIKLEVRMKAIENCLV